MKTNLIPAHLLTFLGKDGLSMSEANHTANLCKEIVRAIDNELSTVTQFSETVKLNGELIALNEGTKLSILDINQKLINKTEVYGLSAWLREGIKAKLLALDLMKHISSLAFYNGVVKDFTKEEPSFHDIARKYNANKGNPITREHVLATFTVKQLAEYYQVEAIAAHIGKAVHNTGFIATLRNKIQNFNKVTLRAFNTNGGKTDLPVISVLPYTSLDAEQLYFTLQQKHRDAEKKFNWYETMIENQINEANSAEEKRYANACLDANAEYQELRAAYNLEYTEYKGNLNVIEAECNAHKMKVINETAALKIIIPEALEGVLKLVKEYHQ